MESMDEWKIWWQEHFGQNGPLGHILRQQIPDRWLRIHSLPESKRYPESPDEYTILLARQTAVATEVLGLNSQCLLLVGRYADPSNVEINAPHLPRLKDVDFTLFDSFDDSGPEEEPEWTNIWCGLVTWSPKAFQLLIEAVARDEERNILFASMRTGEAYHPYDGGADLFVRTKTRRDELKQRFSAWLSRHPQGL